MNDHLLEVAHYDTQELIKTFKFKEKFYSDVEQYIDNVHIEDGDYSVDIVDADSQGYAGYIMYRVFVNKDDLINLYTYMVDICKKGLEEDKLVYLESSFKK
jgi:hypothetical protein